MISMRTLDSAADLPKATASRRSVSPPEVHMIT